jgi:hypothetical protein
MQIQVVSTPALEKLFLEIPVEIYRDDREWIRPLDKDIEAVFDRTKNKAFRHGDATRFILFNDAGKAIGRIAAFVNRKTSAREKQPTGGLGFFECIRDQRAAFILFDSAVEWLKGLGMQAVDGPINFGERDRWWGLLVEGFYEPVYCMNYNPPWYREFFEAYGFREYFRQFCYALKVDDPIDEKFEAAYHRLSAAGEYRAEHIRRNNLEKYAADFATVYNKAWAKHGSAREITADQVLLQFRKMKPVMDEVLVWFAYHKSEPVAMWLNLPELNQYFKHMNGKFGIVQKLQFLWMKWRHTNRKFYGLVFGVVPEHQGKGVDGLMIWSGATAIRKAGHYDFMELQWIGDFNPKMISIAKALGTVQSRTLITYRKIFDPDAVFERFRFES